MVGDDSDSRYYLGAIDLDQPKISHDFLILLTGTGKKVLELGPASGYISKILQEKGCHVTAIEVNPIFAKQATEFTDRIIIGDVEILNLNDVLGTEKFDVILMGDFLEHLKDPSKFLRNICNFLVENGYVVCSIPNVAYITNRIKLLDGEFSYERTGLLDETHLRFFTLSTILSMLDSSGLAINQLRRIKQDFYLPHRTDLNPNVIPEELIESILRDPEATTFQYVFSAVLVSSKTINTTNWLTNSSINATTKRLKEILQHYKKDLPDSLKQKIKEKDLQIYSLQKEVLSNLQKKNKFIHSKNRSDRELELEITICYKEVLNREPDEVGLQYYLSKIRSGELSITEVKDIIMKSSEAKNK